MTIPMPQPPDRVHRLRGVGGGRDTLLGASPRRGQSRLALSPHQQGEKRHFALLAGAIPARHDRHVMFGRL
jgi:hypothetical protein